MEPFARLGKRPKFRTSSGSGSPVFRKKRQASSKDRLNIGAIFTTIANLGQSLHRVPFYRQGRRG